MTRTVWLVCLAASLLAGTTSSQPQRRQRRKPPQPPSNVEVIRDVVYGTGGGRALRLDIARPKEPPSEPMPVVVYIHGGAWRAGSYHGPQNYPLAAKGYFTINIEYRLSSEATFPAQIEDCKAAIRWLRAHAEEYNINTERIGVWGHSAGGHLAALLGTSGDVAELEGAGSNLDQSSSVQAVVDCFGPSDFLKMSAFPSRLDHEAPNSPESLLIGGPIRENPAKVATANPITYIDANDPPFLIVHGEDDDVVPINQSELLYEALRKAGVDATFVRVRNAGHGFNGNPEPSRAEIMDIILQFFEKHIRGIAD